MQLPLGVSPDCQDMAFKPGSVISRPGLTKVLPTALGTVTVTYAKSYIDNSGVYRNLYLDSAGNLWVENITTSPGTVTMLAQVTPGSYAKSITAFGREYIAFSDGIHGTDVALQYDGTNLDRMTQDGPGTPPNVASLALPTVAMQPAGGSPPTTTIASIYPDSRAYANGPFTTINIYILGSISIAPVGTQVFISATTPSGTQVNANGGPYTVISNPGPAGAIVVAFLSPANSTPYVGSGTLTVGTGGVTMTRASNIVTVKTAVAHQLKVGYQAQITGIPAGQIGSGINSIVIKNEDNPGIATVTMTTAHGLVPGLFVSITGVPSVVIGGAISVSRQGGIVTVSTSTPHGLVPGSVFTITGCSDTSFNTSATVSEVLTNVSFTWIQPLDATNVAPLTSGALNINWPVPDTPLPYYYEVVATPTDITFQVQLNFADASFGGGGVVSYAWDGTFYVLSVPDSTTFTYKQYGVDATTTTVGNVTPFGQVAPGEHQCQVMFLTRQGYITAPSPPVKFIANGGQYVSVSNIAVGPSNVVARILAFTGASGAYFFYIPTQAQVDGQIVSTATQINNNTDTSAVLDFSDNTLFRGLGISIPGNDLANQITLDSALGFAFFADRLITWGQRNEIDNLLNMGFDGGLTNTNPPVPGPPQITGWSGTGTIVTGHFSAGVSNPNLSQSFFEDYLGNPIATPNQTYTARAWLSTGTASVTISSVSSGFSAIANLTAGPGGWAEAAFSQPMPATIPSDMTISLVSTAIVDDLSIIFSDNPFINNTFFGSYVNNPEAFDAVSGVFGVEDIRKIMAVGIVRGSMGVLTQDPSGRLHMIQSNAVTEPAGWSSNEVAGNCGILSPFALTVSQADDATAAGGEEWMAWMSYSGARIFGGNQPDKISQEIQPDWDGINAGSYLTTWALNDPASRRIYFGLPKGNLSGGTTAATAPNKIYHVDYKNLETAEEIAGSPPVHVTFTGKLAARDRARKWCPWNIPANGAAMLYRMPGGPLMTVFYAGNGATPGTVSGGCGNVFILCDNKLTDDCLGQMNPYYTTAAFASAEMEQALQLGGQRHLLQYLQWNASGVGVLTITPLVDTLSNAWPITAALTLRSDPTFDDEWGGGQASGQRFFLKFTVAP